MRPGRANGALGDGQPADQETLLGLLDRARRGRGGALVIQGEAGIGKTHLVYEALGRASGGGSAISELTDSPASGANAAI